MFCLYAVPLTDILKAHKNQASIIEKAIKSVADTSIDIQPMFGGFSGSSLHTFEAHGKKYVLRIFDANNPRDKRASEVAAHTVFAKLGLAPHIYYVDEDYSVIIMDFIEGRPFQKSDLHNKPLLTKILRGLKKFHDYKGAISIRKITKLESLNDTVKKYQKRGCVYPTQFKALLDTLNNNACLFLKHKKVPCHGDFNPNNILIDKKGHVFFIDFSESQFDSPFLDLGWICFLSNADVNNVLEVYFGRRPHQSDIKETIYFKSLTAFLAGTFLTTQQKERDIQKLDAIMDSDTKKASDYIKKDITPADKKSMSDEAFTIYAMSFFKEFKALCKSLEL